MKKEDFASILVYTLMLAIALMVGFLIIRPIFESPTPITDLNPYLFVLLAILVGLLLNVIIIEVGHVIGGKIGGYNIISFNLLGLCIYKKSGKWKFGFQNFDGLTGETILLPKNDKASPKAYVWFPFLAYIIELIVGIGLYSIYNPLGKFGESLGWLGAVSIIVVAIGSMIALYNFIPAKLDSMTDGYRLTLITKQVNIDAYNELLRIEYARREGNEVGEIKIFDEITEFTASLNLVTLYEYLRREDVEKASELITKMIENGDKISKTTYNRLLAQKLYLMLITLPIEEVKKYYEKEINDDVRRFISNDGSMESLRAYVLIAGLLDEAPGEVQFAISQKNKFIKRAISANVLVEEKLFNDAINKIYDVHPEWKETETKI